MQVRAKYVTEFTIKNGKIKTSRVIGEEHANANQKKAILASKPMLRAFVASRITNETQFQDCTVNVRVSYVETSHGLELSFRA